MDEDTITIPRGLYDKLVESDEILMFLKAHGVDNWEGYGDAMADYFESE